MDFIPKKDLAEVNNALKGQAITMGDTVKISTNIGDLLAGKASSDGQGLALWSTAKQAINGALLTGQDSLDDLVKNSDVVADELAKLKGSKRGASYIQNVWRRLLVSSPATTAVNVLGFGQYNVGMTIYLVQGNMHWLDTDTKWWAKPKKEMNYYVRRVYIETYNLRRCQTF